MIDLTIVSIVEGHGELQALHVLLRRVGDAHVPGVSIAAPSPIRVPRSKIVKPGELERAVTLAAYRAGIGGGVLVVLDADDGCPAELGPLLLARAKTSARSRFPVSVVLANAEFESWFLAAAESLRGQRGLAKDLEKPPNPEAIRNAKGWLSDRMARVGKYSEVLDQPALAALMNLDEAREGSRSFGKFYRDVARLVDALKGNREPSSVD